VATRKLKAPNGDIIEFDDSQMSAEQAVGLWEKSIHQKTGYDPEFKMDVEGKTREKQQEWMDENPVTAQVASYQAGAKNLGRNLLQMVLPEKYEEQFGVTDEDIKDKQKQEQFLEDEAGAAYLTGEILPTMVIPAGSGANLTTRGGQLLSRYLPKALQTGKTLFPRAAAEGAVFGAATAGPENRTTGALVGATGGAVGNVAGRALSRALTKVAPTSKVAQRVAQAGAQTPRGGETPFIPLSRAAPKTGKGAGTRFLYDSILKNFPSSSRRLAGQSDEVLDTTYRNMIRQAFGKNADDVIKEFGKERNLRDAVIKGMQLEGTRKTVGGQRMQQVLAEAANKARHGRPSMNQIGDASARLYPDAVNQPLRKMADDVADVLGATTQDGGLALRKGFFKLVDIAGLGLPSAIGRILTKPGVQKFLAGNVGAQKALAQALEQGNAQGVQQIMGRIVREAATHKTFDGGGRVADEVRELETQFGGMSE